MTDPNEPNNLKSPQPWPESSWDWATQGYRAVGGCLTLARNVSPEQVIRAFGKEPEDAQTLSEPEGLEANPFGEPPWIRVGQIKDWAFAIEPASQLGWFEDVGQRLSAGTEAIVVAWTATTYTVFYLRDGVIVTRFDPVMAWIRDGTEPGRFVREMRQAGLETETPEAPGLSEERRRRLRDPVIASLDMLTLALGIRLPEDVALGPLLTVQLDPR